MQLQYLTLFLHLHLTLTSFTLKKCFSLWRPDTWSPQGQIFKVKYPYPCVGNVFLKTMCIIILLYCANTPFCHFQTLFCYEKQCLNCTSMRVPSPGNTMYFLFVLSVCVCACVGVCCIWVEIEEQTHIPRPLSWHREHGVSFDLQIHLQMKGFWAKACRRGGRVSARCARSKQASACVCFFFLARLKPKCTSFTRSVTSPPVSAHSARQSKRSRTRRSHVLKGMWFLALSLNTWREWKRESKKRKSRAIGTRIPYWYSQTLRYMYTLFLLNCSCTLSYDSWTKFTSPVSPCLVLCV